jgi:predicted dehydrogenase
MAKTISWGIIGTGQIAEMFADGLAQSQTGILTAVASRMQETADRFGDRWNIPHRYHSYEQILMDEEVQVIYIATPHPFHAEWCIKAANRGKHVVCEKPIGLNYADARAVVDACRCNHVFLLEAFMYRFHPHISKLLELLREGRIGTVRVLQATFAIHPPADPDGRLLKNSLGGGSIMDVGCYCASIARIIAGIALGKDFADPIRIQAVGYLGPTNVDEYSVAVLEFPSGILAQLFCGIQVNADQHLAVYGSEGSIHIQWPFTPRSGKHQALLVKRNDQTQPQIITMETTIGLYTIEADLVAHYIENCQIPEMSYENTLGNMRTLDQWRAAIGMVYEQEKGQR